MVVPARDAEEHLGASLESVLGQTHAPLEVIVVEDGSEDSTAELARSFGERVRVLQFERGLGPAAARNRGVAATRGEMIAFNDSDDLWHPQKLERQLRCFAMNPRLDCCFTHLELFWDEGAAWEEAAVRERAPARADDVPGYAAITLLARRSAFERVGDLEEDRRHSDVVEWVLRARELGVEIEVLEEVLVRHRRRPGSLSRDVDRGAGEFLALVRERIERRRRADGGGA